MARMVADGLAEKGLDVTLKRMEEAHIDSLPVYDGFVIGSPNYLRDHGLAGEKVHRRKRQVF